MKDRIKELQKEKDVAILAHYYVEGEVQEIADYVGDSFYLAKTATKLENKTIIIYKNINSKFLNFLNRKSWNKTSLYRSQIIFYFMFIWAIIRVISFEVTPLILVASPIDKGLTSFKPALAIFDIPFISS